MSADYFILMHNSDAKIELRKFNRQIRKHHKFNFYIIAVRQILFRLGWIFKTESIVIPALTTMLTSSTLYLGLFPMVSRIGKYFPQLFAANFIEPLRKRKYGLIVLNLGAIIPWGIFAALCWMKPLNKTMFMAFFVFAYASFWICTGAGQMTMRTVIGKVILYNFRGRIQKIIGLYSAVFAIIFSLVAAYILKGAPPFEFPYNFAMLFTLTFVLFLVVLTCTILIREPSYPLPPKRKGVSRTIVNAFSLIKTNRNLRRAVIIGWSFSLTAALFPFYTAYAREYVGVPIKLLALSLFIQHGANAGCQIFVGPLADRQGNRFVLLVLGWLAVFIPLVPLVAKYLIPANMSIYFYLVTYLLIGTAVGRELFLQNYILEISSLEKQPLFVGTLNLFVGLSSLFPVIIGALLIVLSYEMVFSIAFVFAAAGAALIFTVEEPRKTSTG
jgi:hypothetical protein